MTVLDGLDLELERVSKGGHIMQGLRIVQQLLAHLHMLLEMDRLKLGVAASTRQILSLFEGVLYRSQDFDGPVRIVELLLVVGVHSTAVDAGLPCDGLASVVLDLELLVLLLLGDDYLL